MMLLMAFSAQTHKIIKVICLAWIIVCWHDMMHCCRSYNFPFLCTPLTFVMVSTHCLFPYSYPCRTLVIHDAILFRKKTSCIFQLV